MGWEADAVVGYRDADRAVAPPDARDLHMFRLRVSAHVRQQLADRPKDDLAHFLVEARVALFERHVALDIAFRAKLLAKP